MSITTTSSLPAPIQASFNKKLLAVPVPNFIFAIPAMKMQMQRNGGTTERWRRYNPLQPALVPLGNSGITPPPQNLTAVDIDAKMSFFGTYVAINEQVTLQNQDPVLNEAAIRLGVSLRQTEDMLTSNMLASTAAFINCVGGFNGDVPTEMTRSDVDTANTTLMGANAYTIMDQIEGADKFGTGPIRRAYFGLSHTDMCGSRGLDNVTGFLQAANYPNNRNTLDSEWGSIGSFRFLVSSIAPTITAGSSGAATVYNNFMVGMQSYGIVNQDGYTSTFVYRPAIYSGPLAQNVTVGWKSAMVPRIFNDQWLLNLRCTLA